MSVRSRQRRPCIFGGNERYDWLLTFHSIITNCSLLAEIDKSVKLDAYQSRIHNQMNEEVVMFGVEEKSKSVRFQEATFHEQLCKNSPPFAWPKKRLHSGATPLFLPLSLSSRFIQSTSSDGESESETISRNDISTISSRLSYNAICGLNYELTEISVKMEIGRIELRLCHNHKKGVLIARFNDPCM